MKARMNEGITSIQTNLIGEGNGSPLQCCCLENPRDSRAWWAAVYGVAKSQTQLKQLSSSGSYSINDEIIMQTQMDLTLMTMLSPLMEPH